MSDLKEKSIKNTSWFLLLGLLSFVPQATSSASPEIDECAEASLEYLRRVMDQYHGNRFWVCDDGDSAGNHFLVPDTFTNTTYDPACPGVIEGDLRDGVTTGTTLCESGQTTPSLASYHSYTPATTGTVTLLCDSMFDAVVAIYDGCPPILENEIVCDDGDSGTGPQVTFNVVAQGRYLIRVASKNGMPGPYRLIISPPSETPEATPTTTICPGGRVSFNAFARLSSIGSPESLPFYGGATFCRFQFSYTDPDDWGALVLEHGEFTPFPDGELRPHRGMVDGGDDLTDAIALKFWARGEKGGERVSFSMGGVGWFNGAPVEGVDFPDSTDKIFHPAVTLTTDWTEYTINLAGRDLSRIAGGFRWETSALVDPELGQPDNDHAVIFYVDSIYYELNQEAADRRLASPRILQSFTPRPIQGGVWDPVVEDFNHRFRTVGFTYDNALALLAFLASGTEADLDRARLIGDAFVYAAEHDRTFDDGRLRSAYFPGDLVLPSGWEPNGFAGEVRLPGFYNTICQDFHGLFIDNISIGNTAWAMIALLGLYERTDHDEKYLGAATKLGDFILRVRDEICSDTLCPQNAFPGGLKDIENPAGPSCELFHSAEHNIDVYAAFKTLYRITDEPKWLDGSNAAADLIWSLWDDEVGCFRAGLGSDCEVNTTPGQLPVDVQAWAVLAIPDTIARFPSVLRCAEVHHATSATRLLEDDDPTGIFGSRSIEVHGFDFNDDRDGVWFEGTAHMATAYHAVGDDERAAFYREQLCTAQQSWMTMVERMELPEIFHEAIGLPAGSHDAISTGFDYTIHKRLHIAATAWNVFAQLGFNPYDQTVRPKNAVSERFWRHYH